MASPYWHISDAGIVYEGNVTPRSVDRYRISTGEILDKIPSQATIIYALFGYS